jgi:hypothetical protein
MKPRTREHSQAIANALRNKPKTSDHKANIAKALKGKPKSEAHKTAISTGLYLRALEKEAERDEKQRQ